MNHDDREGWLTVQPEIASHNWSCQGSIHLINWYVSLVPQEYSADDKLPFAYLLALADRLNAENVTNANIPLKP